LHAPQKSRHAIFGRQRSIQVRHGDQAADDSPVFKPFDDSGTRWMTRDDAGKRMLLKVVMHEAKGLIAKDLNGYSDPFVVLGLAGQRCQTRVVPASLNPIWEQMVYMELPKILDSGTDILTLTVLDYDGPLINAEFLGRVEVHLGDLWAAYQAGGGGSLNRHWYKLLGKKTSKRTDRGSLCMSLAIVDGEERVTKNPLAMAAIERAETLEDINLNEWNLRIRIHEGRGIDRTVVKAGAVGSNNFVHRISVRLGSWVHQTGWTKPEIKYFEVPDAQSASGRRKKGYLRHTWNETIDIPLAVATKTLKLDAKITNRVIHMGNAMGLDGIFYDTREDMSSTEDVRFVVTKAMKENADDENETPERTFILGVGQYPLSGIYSFCEEGCHEFLETAASLDIETNDDDVSESSEPSPPLPEGKISLLHRKSHPNPKPRFFPKAMKGFQDLVDGMVKSGASAPSGKDGELHMVSLEDSKTDGHDPRASIEQSIEDTPTPILAQQTWIRLDGRGGQSEGELLVSFLFVKDMDKASEAGAAAKGGDVDFDTWVSDCVEAEDEQVTPMTLPPPLKDGTFVSEELNLPLHKLFYHLCNQESKFNKIRMSQLEIREFHANEWSDAEGAVKKKSMDYIIKLPPNKLGPNEAYTEVEMIVEALSRTGFVVRNVIKCPKITFGDTFFTCVQLAAVPTSMQTCKLELSFSIDFVKSTIFKSTIQKASIEGANHSAQAEMAILKKIANGELNDNSEFPKSVAMSEHMAMASSAPLATSLGFNPVQIAVLVVLGVAIMLLLVLQYSVHRVMRLQSGAQLQQAEAMGRLADALQLLTGALQGGNGSAGIPLAKQ